LLFLKYWCTPADWLHHVHKKETAKKNYKVLPSTNIKILYTTSKRNLNQSCRVNKMFKIDSQYEVPLKFFHHELLSKEGKFLKKIGNSNFGL